MRALRASLFFVLLSACAARAEPARCGVCGMNPAQYPRWRTSVTISDGSELSFDSPRCLFRFLENPGRHRRGATVAAGARVRAVEYYSQRSADARTLHYVKGSDVMGPMGPDYVPIRGLREARQFLADHEGDAILTFAEAVRTPP